MKNEVVNIPEIDVFEKARDYFIAICGFDLNREKHRKMMDQGLQVRENGLAGIQMKAVISSFEEDVFRDGGFMIGETEFHCDAFRDMNKANFKGLYTYIVTVGECKTFGDNIMELLYADSWGVSYVEAARVYLQQEITSHIIKNDPRELGKEIFLSDVFGPGYYGMSVNEVPKFFNVLDGGIIGVQLRTSGLMIPVKSCIGCYALLDDPDCRPKSSCRDCIGNKGSCQYCKANAGVIRTGG